MRYVNDIMSSFVYMNKNELTDMLYSLWNSTSLFAKAEFTKMETFIVTSGFNLFC